MEDIYRNLQRIYVLLDDGDRRALREVGLSASHHNLLRLLGTDSDEGRSVSELARVLLCTRGNVTRLVQRLAEAGLVTTGPGPADLRLVRVHLTRLGQKRLAAADAVLQEANRRRFSGLSARELAQLRELTSDLVDQLIKDRDG
ncbi:MarR family winged helix-turn-helix transcriptional regulator [Allorhizocola rhizosphaerae]|uniref:MarR family winged helix-turn-helix transcriptional regulator n=1 Tax=Allorhizocola rhizosphaerae TaxID=1872709 RepID=UPI000E3E5AA9|nr:MarR family transcriptional regulator [Allorhizocola rhizosphaerae]